MLGGLVFSFYIVDVTNPPWKINLKRIAGII